MRTIDELGISPEPWKDGGFGVPKAIKDGNGEIIVTVHATKHMNANERLTKSAPKLYECLYYIVKELCEKCLYEENGVCKGSKMCYVQRYKKVLAKAGGEEVEK